jgi:YihY family inner membrane protein
VSSAALVPETRTLTGDDAIKVLQHVGKGPLLKAALRRFRVADGFSHARSLAFLIALVCIQGIIGLVGLSNLLHQGNFSRVIVASIRKIVPGPAGRELTTAVVQAHRAVDSHHYSAILFATIAGLIAATTAMGQLERGLNRIYGVEQDRPSVLKYGFAFLLALSAGTLAILSFACLAFTRTIFQGTNLGFIASMWSVLRWPLGLALMAVAVTLLFRWSPRRAQPHFSWLALGAAISVVLWGLATAALGIFYQSSSTFGNTYGVLAGIVALWFWCLLSSIAIFYGAAVAAQLEAIRAGVRDPQDIEKVIESEPEAKPSPLTEQHR